MMSLREDGVEKRSLVCGLWGVTDRETGETFLYVSWKREGREGWRELRHGIQKISFYWRIPRQTHLEGCSKKRLGVVKELEVSSGFCKRHASRSLSLFPFVRMIYAG